ncbi:MAG TPA: glycosyltransferase family 2 protein [Miltoncostaeaceae bacterium]|nr:glycosyltransferase family 2 protein [Miltoncostaeaceae bacterium]
MSDPRPQDVSVVIAVKADNPNLRESLAHLVSLEDAPGEIIVLPDAPFEPPPGVRVIPTGPTGPSEKRDIGAAAAGGSILAFLDDDAYPAPGWLRAATAAFAEPGVGAVGGPGVTPSSDPFLAQVSGDVYASPLVSGPHVRRYLPRAATAVDDWPSCNLLVRSSAFHRAGGFDSTYWPGEDTVFCLKLTHDLGLEIRYVPEALVYHHRRPGVRRHLRQAAQYALHRGYFVKRFPQTSRRPSYFAPSALVMWITAGWLPGLRNRRLRLVWAGGVAAYVAALAVVTPTKGRPARYALALVGSIATHLTYGLWFMRGLLARRIPDERSAPPPPEVSQ